jgi:putative phosphonate metabolism protein
MSTSPRYALYFVPEEDTALSAFGRWWFARAANTPRYGRLPELAAEGLNPNRQWDIVAAARRYGFHATLKPPFRLAAGRPVEELIAAAAQLARACRRIAAEPLRLDELDGFLALRPGSNAAAIDDLAEECVRRLDGFRAPPSPEETARRLNGGLAPRQAQLLAEWGYPYILDQYRFHLTLTARLDDTERADLRRILTPRLHAVEEEPLRIDSLCLCVQSQPDRPFVLRRRLPLGE